MNNTVLKKTVLLASCVVGLLISNAAYAENLFLLQLGMFSSKENAHNQFTLVESQYGSMLSGKRYLLRKSRPLSGGETSWRVLVGPFDSRKNASRTCAELKDKGEDCFVVETAAVNLDEFEDATQVASSEPKRQEPATESETTIAEQTISQAGDSSLMPWNWFDDVEAPSILPTGKSAAVPKAVASTTSTSGKRININTRSVYTKEKQPTAQANLGDMFGDLFAGDTTSDEPTIAKAEQVVEPKIQPAPSPPAAPVVDVETETKPTAEAKEPIVAKSAQRTGEVEVAEAIPVPLMEPENVPVTTTEPVTPILTKPSKPAFLDVKLPSQPSTPAPAVQATPKIAQPVMTPTTPTTATTVDISKDSKAAAPQAVAPTPRYPAPPTRTAVANYQASQAARLLQISVFANDRDAFQCLNYLQSHITSAALLRTRIIKSTTGKAVIRFGPVNDHHLEAELCDATTQCGADLRCRIVTEQKPRQARLPRRMVDKDLSSAPKPKDMTPRTPVINAPAKQTTLMNKPTWVQLGTSSSKSDAASRFSGLQKQHPDLLGKLNPTINTPEQNSLAGNVYRLRIGPFDSRSDAQGLCATLSSRGVGCLVLSK